MTIEKNKVYFATTDFYEKIREVGGSWNDTKERPIICLMKLKDSELYWAIPMGDYDHRNEEAKVRIEEYIAKEEKKIQSCFYHIGKTTKKSIFFISDIIPITKKYIERGYTGYGGQTYEMKNPKLIQELERKLKRILMFEDKRNNYFRQRITDLKQKLLNEPD